MPIKLDDKLVVGISSRALFDLEEENAIYEREGLAAYTAYQIEHEQDILKPGIAFPLVRALEKLNADGRYLCETIVMSRNSADTSLRIFNSLEHYGLSVTRAALTGGASMAPYLSAFQTDLFLSANAADVQAAINAGIAAGLICDAELAIDPAAEISQIRIAFDGDAVIFSDASERIYQEHGLAAFAAHEQENAHKPLPEGPFAKFLKSISMLQKQFDKDSAPIRTALVTARNAPSHERVIRTLRAWDVRIDEAFFLGGIPKSEVLRIFGAHIFFDDQRVHTDLSQSVIPSAHVPWKTE